MYPMVFAEGESGWALSVRVFIVHSFRCFFLGLVRVSGEDVCNMPGKYKPACLPGSILGVKCVSWKEKAVILRFQNKRLFNFQVYKPEFQLLDVSSHPPTQSRYPLILLSPENDSAGPCQGSGGAVPGCHVGKET